MDGARGSLRFVDPDDPAPVKEVYYRPPPSYLEPDTLLTVLRHRLRREPTTAGQDASEKGRAERSECH